MNKIIEKIIDWEKSIPNIEKVTNLQILEYFELKGKFDFRSFNTHNSLHKAY